MDINSLFSTQNILQSVCVGILVWTIRSFIELKFPNIITNKKFTGIFLPTLSLITSIIISFGLPIAGLSLRDTVLNGLLCGFSSSFLFSALKGLLIKGAE